MSVWVPKALAGYYAMQAAHAAEDAEKQDSVEHARSHEPASNQPSKPLARARENPNRGSKHNRHLVAQAVASMAEAASLLAPVTRMPSAAASAFAPAINMATSGITTAAASLSNAMAKGVNATMDAAFETSKAFASAVPEAVRSASRDRGRVDRFMLPMVRVA